MFCVVVIGEIPGGDASGGATRANTALPIIQDEKYLPNPLVFASIRQVPHWFHIQSVKVRDIQ